MKCLVTLLLFCFVSSCFGDAYVRILHASPDTPPVDIYVDGARALNNVPFKTFTNDYVRLPAGTRNVQVWPSGNGSGQGTPALNVNLTLTDNTFYLAAAVGLLSGTGNQALRIQAYVDTVTTTASNTRIRAIHLSPDAPEVILTLGGDASSVLVDGVSFPSATSYLNVPAGNYAFDVRPKAAPGTVALAIPSLAYAGNTAYSAIVVGRLGSLEVLRTVDAVVPPTPAPTTAAPTTAAPTTAAPTTAAPTTAPTTPVPTTAAPTLPPTTAAPPVVTNPPSRGGNVININFAGLLRGL